MLRKFRALMVPAYTVLCPCSADDPVLLDKKETVLQGMLDRLTEIGRWYGMEMNVEKTRVTRISMQLSPIQIAIYKTPNNVEYFNFFV
jgi:hypothetical protein